MTTDVTMRRPLSDPDAGAIIGLLAILEGELLAETLDVELAGRFRDRLVDVGLLADSAGLGELRRALGELNQRVRYALGEYAEPPAPEGPATHAVEFPDEAAAAQFRAAVASRWPGGNPAVASTPDRPASFVGVEDAELPLTGAFRAHQGAIEELAGQLGGDYAGYGY
ncbi:MAG TPA: hypothetical protein VGO19_00515 [Actinomycetes bacterium]|jgi:hypothetical protein